MSEKVEYTACILAEGTKVNSVSIFTAEGGSNRRSHRITRDDRFVLVEELSAPFRVYEIPRELCVLERHGEEKKGPGVAKAASK